MKIMEGNQMKKELVGLTVLLVTVMAISSAFVHNEVDATSNNCCLDAYLAMYYFGFRYDATCHVFMPSDCNCEDVILTCR